MISNLIAKINETIDPTQMASTPDIDMAKAWYLISALTLGALAALASLLGSDRVLEFRVVATYLLAGSIVSLGVILLLVEQYGFSYFLVGISIFAGYKAFDVLALISVGVTSLVKRFLNKQTGNVDSEQKK